MDTNDLTRHEIEIVKNNFDSLLFTVSKDLPLAK